MAAPVNPNVMHTEIPDTNSVSFRGDHGELLKLSPLYRAYPNEQDYWDGNWVQTEVDVKVGGFRGKFLANLRCEEFAELQQQLEALESELTGKAQFRTMEEWLEININGDGLGRFSLESFVRDDAGIGNRLEFGFSFDQTYIPALLSATRAVTSAFPVRGQANA